MNAAATMGSNYRQYEEESFFAGMKTPLTFSLVLHVLVFFLGLVSLPFLAPAPIIMPSAVTIEMVDISEIAMADNLAAPNKPEDVSEEKPETTQEPVYNKEEAPVLETPKEPEIEEVPPPPLEKPEPPKPEPEAVSMPEDVKPAPVPKIKPKPPKPKPEPKKVEEKPKKEKVEEKPKRDINSLLKDITPDDKKEKTLDQLLNESTSQSSKPSQIAAAGDRITASEIDAIRRGIEPCWFVDPGVENARDMRVTLRVHVGPDFIVKNVEIIESGRSDPMFRSFAEAASRALTNPRCSRLNIPPDKYDQFQVFRVTFDPSGMI